ncbi:MAG: hypothetical protein U9N52_04845 [Campylobacterota bacterium]|nr:hypothetical protein [Campylobacterota bacterium]
MSLKELIKEDLDLFLNEDEFAISATFNGTQISILFDEISEENFNIKVAICKIDDVIGINTSSIFIIDNISYTVNSFSKKDGLMEIVLNVQY